MKKATLQSPCTAITTLTIRLKKRFAVFVDQLELHFCALQEPLLFPRSRGNIYPALTYPSTNNNSL